MEKLQYEGWGFFDLVKQWSNMSIALKPFQHFPFIVKALYRCALDDYRSGVRVTTNVSNADELLEVSFTRRRSKHFFLGSSTMCMSREGLASVVRS